MCPLGIKYNLLMREIMNLHTHGMIIFFVHTPLLIQYLMLIHCNLVVTCLIISPSSSVFLSTALQLHIHPIIPLFFHLPPHPPLLTFCSLRCLDSSFEIYCNYLSQHAPELSTDIVSCCCLLHHMQPDEYANKLVSTLITCAKQ